MRHFVYLSSLAVMTSYPESFVVDEDWRPLAKGDSPGLAEYLGEVVCREFTREGKIHPATRRGRWTMNVLLIGACGYLGPHVAKALAPRHRLRITDIRPPSAAMKRELAGHEFRIDQLEMET